MGDQYAWDEKKRRANLEKHNLDFADADLVIENAYRMDVDTVRKDELRRQSFAYVFDVLFVLAVVYKPGKISRIISFRYASVKERQAYYEWLKDDCYDV